MTTGWSGNEARPRIVGVTWSVAAWDPVDKVLAVTAYARRRKEAALIQLCLIVVDSAIFDAGVEPEAIQSSRSFGSRTTAPFKVSAPGNCRAPSAEGAGVRSSSSLSRKSPGVGGITFKLPANHPLFS